MFQIIWVFICLRSKKGNIIWAKNYKIWFSSNLKIYKKNLIAANQNNDLYYFNKSNGEMLNLIPTEETIFKKNLLNNLSFKWANFFI